MKSLSAGGSLHFMKYLCIALNPADQLGHSAVNTWLIAPTAALSPAHHSCQPPVPAGCLTDQGSTTVSLETGIESFSGFGTFDQGYLL